MAPRKTGTQNLFPEMTVGVMGPSGGDISPEASRKSYELVYESRLLPEYRSLMIRYSPDGIPEQ